MNRGEKSSLEPAHQESIRRYFGKGGSPVLQQCENAPADIEEGDQVVHGDYREQEHKGDLAHNCADGVHSLELDELVSLEVEVFFHARDVGIILLGGEGGILVSQNSQGNSIMGEVVV